MHNSIDDGLITQSEYLVTKLASHHRIARRVRNTFIEIAKGEVARAELAFLSAAAHGCQPADSEAGRFWAVFGLLTTMESSTFTCRPGVCCRKQRPLRESETLRRRPTPATWASSATCSPGPRSSPPPLPPRSRTRGRPVRRRQSLSPPPRAAAAAARPVRHHDGGGCSTQRPPLPRPRRLPALTHPALALKTRRPRTLHLPPWRPQRPPR